MAIRALSKHNPELLTRLYGTVIKILRDTDETVVKTALTVATCMFKVRWLLSSLTISNRGLNKDDVIALKVRTSVNNILESESYVDESSQWFISKVLNCLNVVGSVILFTLIFASSILIAPS